jgi:hypothetical protein
MQHTRYWHIFTLVQYQYGHSPLPVLAFKNGARAGIGVFTHLFSTSMGVGIVRYWYWHSIVPVPQSASVLAFKNGPCTSIGISALWFSTSMSIVYYRYWHSKNGAHTGIGIFALWFSTSMGRIHYRYWHSKMEPVPVLACLHFCLVSVWARVITGTGISISSTDNRNLRILVPTTIPVLEDYNTKTTICKLILNCNLILLNNTPPQTHHELVTPIIVLPFGVVTVTGRGTDSALYEATAVV